MVPAPSVCNTCFALPSVLGNVIAPVFILPVTSKLSDGLFVPIPTFLLPLITIAVWYWFITWPFDGFVSASVTSNFIIPPGAFPLPLPPCNTKLPPRLSLAVPATVEPAAITRLSPSACAKLSFL